MTPHDFRDYYKTISNTELLHILEHQKDYQLTAIEAAKKEFENRQLTEEEISKAREPIITRQLEKEEQRKKVINIKNKVQSASNVFVDTLNPIQGEKLTSDKLIRIISITFFALFLFKIISGFRMFSLMIKNISNFDSSVFSYFLPFVILPIASVIFWMRKTIGWMLLSFYVIYSAIGLIWIFIEDFTWKPTGTSFDNLFPKPSLIVYIIQILFFAGTMYTISKANIRVAFKIDKPRLIATLFMSVLVAIFLMLEY